MFFAGVGTEPSLPTAAAQSLDPHHRPTASQGLGKFSASESQSWRKTCSFSLKIRLCEVPSQNHCGWIQALAFSSETHERRGAQRHICFSTNNGGHGNAITLEKLASQANICSAKMSTTLCSSKHHVKPTVKTTETSTTSQQCRANTPKFEEGLFSPATSGVWWYIHLQQHCPLSVSTPCLYLLQLSGHYWLEKIPRRVIKVPVGGSRAQLS